MPLALTLWAATRVPVMRDTKEMELPVLQVCKLNLMMFINVNLVELKAIIRS